MAKTDAYVLINKAVAIGSGQSIQLPANINDHLIECFYEDANASVSVVVVDVEFSLDDPAVKNDAAAKWYQMGQHTLTAGELTALQAAFVILNVPARRIRANLTILTGEDGSADKFTVRYQPLYRGRI